MCPAGNLDGRHQAVPGTGGRIISLSRESTHHGPETIALGLSKIAEIGARLAERNPSMPRPRTRACTATACRISVGSKTNTRRTGNPRRHLVARQDLGRDGIRAGTRDPQARVNHLDTEVAQHRPQFSSPAQPDSTPHQNHTRRWSPPNRDPRVLISPDIGARDPPC